MAGGVGAAQHASNNNVHAVASNHLANDIQALVSQKHHNASSPSVLEHQQMLNQFHQIQLHSQVAAAVASSQQQAQSRSSQFTNLSPNQVIADDSVLQPAIILQEQLSPQHNNAQSAIHMGEMLF